jgi:hypothetical protein
VSESSAMALLDTRDHVPKAVAGTFHAAHIR